MTSSGDPRARSHAGLPVEKRVARWNPPVMPAALVLACKQRIADCVERYRQAGIRLSMPTVSFDLRGRTAGKAFLHQNHVQLNAILLKENAEEFIEQTVGHEVAHLATTAKYGAGVQAHGAQWQQMMRLIGLSPDRCHSFDTSNSAVSKATYRYLCGCKEHWLTSRRDTKARRGLYRCKSCGQTLRYAPSPSDKAPSAPVPRLPASRPPFARPSPLPTSRPAPTPRPVPTVRPAPVARPPGALPPPTESMLRYALHLANSRGLVLTPAMQASYAEVARFIDQAKVLAPREPQQTTPAAPRLEPPTERQLDYARHLAQRTGMALTEEALASRVALSAWISGAVAQMQGR